METETISKIATALVRAKLHFKPIDVSLSDKSAHAPLETILAAITVPLANEGLTILQPLAADCLTQMPQKQTERRKE